MSPISLRCTYLLCFHRSMLPRPGLPPATPQKPPPKPRRSPPPRVTPGLPTPRVHLRPDRGGITVPGPAMAARHLGGDRVTQLRGSWACLPPRPQDPRLQHRRGRVSSGWTSIVLSLWRLWLASRGNRAVPTSCSAGCRTGTNITAAAAAAASRQVAETELNLSHFLLALNKTCLS